MASHALDLTQEAPHTDTDEEGGTDTSEDLSEDTQEEVEEEKSVNEASASKVGGA